MYKKRGRCTSNELKSVALKSGERERFARALDDIRQRHPDIQFVAITVRKENVGGGFRRHPNGLYNFMVKCLLLEIMSRHDRVSFIPDARSIKIDLKHGLHDYLATELAALGDTFLQTTPWESKDCLPLQFVDILAGIVWSHYEFGNGTAYRAANPHIHQRRLFFGDLP